MNRFLPLVLSLSLIAASACGGPSPALRKTTAEPTAPGPANHPTPQVIVEHVDHWIAQSIEDVLGPASLIAVGRVTRELGSWNLMRDPSDIQKEASEISPGTDYEVRVERYLRGHAGGSIVVTRTGGTYKGQSRPPTAEPFEIDRRYVFFLRKSPIGDRYLLSALPGHWRIENDQTVPAKVLVGPPNAQPIPPLPLEDLYKRLERERPAVDVAAFRGHGRLAFVWDGRLYVLDGDAGTLLQVTHSGQATAPAWSADGRWLAYVHLAGAQGGYGQLRIVSADGSEAREVEGLPAAVGPRDFAWSPASNVIAIAPGGGQEAKGLWLYRPNDGPRAIAAADARVHSLAWSPDGKTLAYSVTLPFQNSLTRSDALYTVAAEGGDPVRRFVAERSGIKVAGWRPDGRGILFWIAPMHSASLSADGMALYALPSDGGEPRSLGSTLGYREWLSWSPEGKLLLVSGAGRQVWTHKTLATCDVSVATCRDVPQPEGAVSLDPAWSPDASRIAFVRADSAREWPNDSDRLKDWVSTRRLWIAAPDGGEARAVRDAGAGVYSPAWSRDGRHLLYLRDDAVWLIGAGGGAPVKVLGPFPKPPARFGYYGHVTWSETLAWYRR